MRHAIIFVYAFYTHTCAVDWHWYCIKLGMKINFNACAEVNQLFSKLAILSNAK